MLGNKTVSEVDREQIEEWIFLKQECEECLSSCEVIRCEKPLVPIQETDEPDDAVSDLEMSCQQNSDNDSDSESQRPDLNDKIDGLIAELRTKTDKLVRDKNDNPTIGLLLCKTKNNFTAEYTLRNINRPIGVAEYQIDILKAKEA